LGDHDIYHVRRLRVSIIFMSSTSFFTFHVALLVYFLCPYRNIRPLNVSIRPRYTRAIYIIHSTSILFLHIRGSRVDAISPWEVRKASSVRSPWKNWQSPLRSPTMVPSTREIDTLSFCFSDPIEEDGRQWARQGVSDKTPWQKALC
jgi:hypothetical protein